MFKKKSNMVIRVETVWYRLLEWWAIADMTSQIGPLCLISQRGVTLLPDCWLCSTPYIKTCISPLVLEGF